MEPSTWGPGTRPMARPSMMSIPGVEELISKNSNGSRYVLIPNGLGQSFIGVKGNEAIAGDWSLVFNLQNGFDPYTLQRANGPKSLVQNNTPAPVGEAVVVVLGIESGVDV